jgi:hypothetical protein
MHYVIKIQYFGHTGAPLDKYKIETGLIEYAREVVAHAIFEKAELSVRLYRKDGSYSILASAWHAATGEYKSDVDASLKQRAYYGE